MAIQLINTGTSANSGNGDSIRTAFHKVNQNFNLIQGMISGTSVSFNSGVQDVVKPMFVHDAHNGLTAGYNSINNRVILSLGSSTFTASNIITNNLTVFNTATVANAFFTGTVNFGFAQGFDDVNIIRFSPEGSTNFRIRNTFGLGSSEINLLDVTAGSFSIVHQNSSGNRGLFSFGQNYIFDDQGRAINIGRAGDINFYSRLGWSSYVNPELSILNTGTVLINSTLTLSKNFFRIGGKRVEITGTTFEINGKTIFAEVDRLIAGDFTATLTTAGNLVLPGNAILRYDEFIPAGQTVTNYGAVFSTDAPFSGVGSLFLNGSSRIEVNGGSHFDLNLGEYTIEWFQKPTTLPTTPSTLFILGTVENQILQSYASVLSGTTVTNAVIEGLLEYSGPFSTGFVNTWTHIAYVKTVNTFSIYINGLRVLTTNTDLFPSPITTTSNLVIGARNFSGQYQNSFTGYISNMRWEASVVYQDNFVVPTSKLTATGFTRLLLNTENKNNFLFDVSGTAPEQPQRLSFVINSSSMVLNQNGVLVLNQNVPSTAYESHGTTVRIDTDQANNTQMIIKNRNAGTTATSEIVLSRNDGDAANGTGILDIGINSSNYLDANYDLHQPGSAFIFSNDADLVLGTQSANKKIVFHTGGTTTASQSAYVSELDWSFGTNIVPFINNNYDIGSTTSGWRTLYLGGTVFSATNIILTDQNSFFIGTATYYLNLKSTGEIELKSKQGQAGALPDIFNPPLSATSGTDVKIIAGSGGSNAGNSALGAGGGNITLEAGAATSDFQMGGSIYLKSGDGILSFGNVVIDTGNNEWTFSNNGGIVFPDSSVQNTAWTGNLVGSFLTSGTYNFQLLDSGRAYFDLGKIDFGHDESAWLSPNNTTYLGEKLVFYSNGGAYVDEFHMAQGVESGHMWFAVHAKNDASYGFKWYGEDQELMKLDSNGDLRLTGHFLPATNLSHDLGSSSTQWRSLYVGTTTIYLGGTALSVSGGNLTIDGSPVSGGGGSTSTLVNGTYTVALTTAGVTQLPGGLTVSPLGNFVPIAGTAIQQNENEILQIVSKGLSGGMTIGWAENPFEPSMVAALTFNATAEQVRIATGSYTGTVNTWAFDQTGNIVLPSGGGIIFDSSATSTLTGVSEVIFADGTTQTSAWVAGGSSSLNSSLISINDFPNASFINSSSLSISYDAYSGGPSFNFAIDYQIPLTENIGIDVGAIKTPYILSTSTVELKTNLSSSTSTWIFNTAGELQFPNGTTQITAYGFVSPPLTSISTGSTGTLAVDSSYLYVCTATNSWQRIAWDTNPW